VRCHAGGNEVVVKVYEKIPSVTDTVAVQAAKQQLELIRSKIHPHRHPNVLPYNRWGETDRACFLVRQLLRGNLRDRQNTRPFLDHMEKLFITYQLLQAVAQVHSTALVHGDICAENFLVTSWNWVLLSDFAPHKPTYLPLDDTAPFMYFFSSNKKRDACCVAPERFNSQDTTLGVALVNAMPMECAPVLGALMNPDVAVSDADHLSGQLAQGLNVNDNPQGPDENDFGTAQDLSEPALGADANGHTATGLLPSMDIFSLGCVITELFQDGEPCFELGELLKYAKREPGNAGLLENKLKKLSSQQLRSLIRHMLSDAPNKRLSAEAYLSHYTGEGKLFPEYFPFLHNFLARFLGAEFDHPDDRIWTICKSYHSLVEQICGVSDVEGRDYFSARYAEWSNNKTEEVDDKILEAEEESDTRCKEDDANISSRHCLHPDTAVVDLLEGTERLVQDLAKLNGQPAEVQSALEKAKKSLESQKAMYTRGKEVSNRATAHGEWRNGWEICGFETDSYLNLDQSDRKKSDGIILVISLLGSTIRHVRFPSTKIATLRLMQRLGRYASDEIRLQRIVPFVVDLLTDPNSLVHSTALRVLSSVLFMVQSVPSSDSRLFPDYIFPAIKLSQAEGTLGSRIALAECLPRLAETSARFLELDQLSEKEKSTYESFDKELEGLHSTVQTMVSNMIEQPTIVRRTLLKDITRLCLFFGRERTSEHILPIVFTVLNERTDWQLRATFFEHIPGVSAFVGPIALQQFLLPCIIQALNDSEEHVIERTIGCLYALVQLGLLNSTMMCDVTEKVLPLVYHPSNWIRAAVVRLLAGLISSERLGLVEVQITIVRILRPVLRQDALKRAVLLGHSKDINESERLLNLLLQDPLDRSSHIAALEQMESEMGETRGKETTPGNGSALPVGGARRDVEKDDVETSQTLGWAYVRGDNDVDLEESAESSSASGVKNVSQEPALLSREISPEDVPKIEKMKAYLRGSVLARRGERAKPSPTGYSRSDEAEVYSLWVPDQSQITLAVHKRYAELLQQNISSLTAGTIFLRENDPFWDLVNRYGIQIRRRHGGGPQTTEALSAGFRRLQKRIKALDVNPLPPKMGPLRKLEDGAAFVAKVRRPSSALGSIVDTGDHATTRDAASTPNEAPWRPRGVLAANLYGHESAVNRICASQDSLFFATGSDDGTVRLWLTAGLEEGYGIQPRLIYSQGGSIKDLCMIENTHSIASVSTDGCMHVFRVEHALEATRQAIGNEKEKKSGITTPSSEDRLLDRSETRANSGAVSQGGTAIKSTSNRRVNLATSVVVRLNREEHGAIRSICHFPTLSESVLAFGSDSGTVHGWDLRCQNGAWSLLLGPQAGLITSVAVPPEGDAVWMVAGTSRGYLVLFDLRFHIPLRAWRHPSHMRIHRLHISPATCSDPLVFVAAGPNEFALYNVASGDIMKGYSTVEKPSTAESAQEQTESPDSQICRLEPVDMDQLRPLSKRSLSSRNGSPGMWGDLSETDLGAPTSDHSVRAMMCVFNPTEAKAFHAHIPTAVISAGTDRVMRYWHEKSPLCYSIFDQDHESSSKQCWDTRGRVTVCTNMTTSGVQPSSEGLALPHPSSNHEDAILDLAMVRSHSNFSSGGSNPYFLLSAARDGVVKAWM